MTEGALRKFCESPRRSLIVIAGTFVVGLVLVLPIVDVYCAERNENKALRNELDSARHVALGMERYESRVADKLAQLAALEERTVDEESLPVLRGKLLDLAKETGCSIRRLTVGAASSRPWTADDDPISAKVDAKGSESDTGFELVWRPVSISLSGANANLRDLVERIATSGMFMHVKSLEMYPTSPSRQSLTLDMELWYFTLTRRG